MESIISDACADPENFSRDGNPNDNCAGPPFPPPPRSASVVYCGKISTEIPEVSLIIYEAKVFTHHLPLASLRKELKCEHCLNCLHMKF